MSKQLNEKIECLKAELFTAKELLRYERIKTGTLTEVIYNIPNWIVRLFNK